MLAENVANSTLHSTAGLWSYSLPAVRTTNSCMENRPVLPGPAGSSPHLLPSPSPRTRHPTVGVNSPSTSLSLLEAKLWTWPPSAAPPTAMQTCTPPCRPSVKPPWTSTNCTWPVRSRAKSPTKARTRRTRRRRAQSAKVGPNSHLETRA